MQRPKIWSLTATDSSAGAGAFADCKIAHELGCDLEVVVLAITAQNSQGVQAAFSLPIEQVKAQWKSLAAEGWPNVIRLGWLPNDKTLLCWLLEALAQTNCLVVWDTVLAASFGEAMTLSLNQENNDLCLGLLQRADIITPNLNEALSLAGLKKGEEKEAALRLQELGARHVLITGLAGENNQLSDYFLFNAASAQFMDELPGISLLREFYLTQPRIEKEVHGTGCHLAASLACFLALGETLYDALIKASIFTHLAIKNAAPRIKQDQLVPCSLNQETKEDWPHLSADFNAVNQPFPRPQKELGLYGLVDNLEHLKRLLDLGIETLQWRVKTHDMDYEKNTALAIKLCALAGVPLYINDDWRLAIKLQAYGVHLGQEDLTQADLAAIKEAGLYLGVSTHTDWELARALAIKPSYIALGPVFTPLSKRLKYRPLGVQNLMRYRRLFPEIRFTTIGGITEHNAALLWQTGIGSLAIVTALANDQGLVGRMARLLEAKVWA